MNNYLIDTHVLLWYIQGNPRLSTNTISIIDNPQNKVFVSKVSLWEIAIKVSIGKLTIHIPFEKLDDFLNDKEFIILDFNLFDLSILKTLPFHHTDPFDRLIISQAINNNLRIISDDSKFSTYPVDLVNV
jgi:PIN domain nuclease of toxin-antitoxin system